MLTLINALWWKSVGKHCPINALKTNFYPKYLTLNVFLFNTAMILSCRFLSYRCLTNGHHQKKASAYIRPVAEEGRCDISAELMCIGFSRPKFNVHFGNHG